MLNRNIEYEIADFVFRVFEVFRKIICPNVETRIICSYNTEVAHTSVDTIYINIEDIFNKNIDCINNYEEYMLRTKRFILEVIIHELYHVEQHVILVKYNKSKIYRSNIEHQVIYMTNVFLLKNSYYIYQLFGVTLDEERIYKIINTLSNYHSIFYDRFINNYESYYQNIISGIIRKSNSNISFNDINLIIRKIKKMKNVVIKINGNEYKIKNNFIYNNNCNELNILNKYISCISLVGEIKLDILNDGESCILQVQDNSLRNLFTELKEGGQ